jgi:protein TonB
LAAVAASAVEAPGVRAETTFARLPPHAGSAAPTPPLPRMAPPSVPGLGATDAAHHAALSPNPTRLPSAPTGAQGGETRSPRGLPDNRLPSYPPTAREDGLEGTVGLTVELDERGHVLAVRWARRTGHMVLDQAARDAVKSWRFTPALRDGHAVPGVLTVAIHFRLDSAAPQTQTTAVADATTP